MILNEPDEIRRAFGCYPTGVAVVTTVAPDGSRVGMTISSFNPVSLEPPLVLWNLAKESCNYEAFAATEHFAVHVLADHQGELSARFAARSGDKFEGLECGNGVEGDPILPEFAGCFQCKTEHRYPGGDHMIIVGRVVYFEDHLHEPLIFHRSSYRRVDDVSS
jgi:3-hydroxy-9,10-secoandrosta-1,3,5(10)-triene-9,17-dione monooxygenase reductase component